MSRVDAVDDHSITPQKRRTCAHASGGTASAALMGLLCEYASPGKAWANQGISG